MHIYPFHLFLLSISLIPYFNLCLKGHASVLQNTTQLPWKGSDRNVGVCAMAINAGSFLMSVAVESLTMFSAFCMAPVHKWKVWLFQNVEVKIQAFRSYWCKENLWNATLEAWKSKLIKAVIFFHLLLFSDIIFKANCCYVSSNFLQWTFTFILPSRGHSSKACNPQWHWKNCRNASPTTQLPLVLPLLFTLPTPTQRCSSKWKHRI